MPELRKDSRSYRYVNDLSLTLMPAVVAVQYRNK